MIEYIINELAKSNAFLVTTSLSSFIGFVLSIFIWRHTSNYQKRYTHHINIDKFNKNRKHSMNKLIAYKDLVHINKILDDKLISDICIEILNYSSYKGLITLEDRLKIFIIMRHLNKKKENIEARKLCIQMSYFINKYGINREGLF